ncbi:MAG TPA: ABC transporter ATP-binding protein [Parcubacteria group bacterium]|nr:ABC transporter ATP-binding protein [Parcubacteria group bacterium]
MDILWNYLKKYWRMCLLVLLLASVNQVFSLLDPYIFRLVVDNYATKFGQYTFSEFVIGVSRLLLLTVGMAFVSRVAKNFQDYYLNSITKRLGAQLYADGVKHSLALPYRVFEDQRSGETLNMLQKSRTDSENFITSVINIVFVSLVGFIFVTIYAINLYWGIAVAYGLTAPIIGFVIYFLSNKVKLIQERIVKETVALAGSTTESLRNIELVKSLGLSDQEIGRLNNTTEKILSLELQKLKYIRSISFIQGTIINFLRTGIQLFMFVLIFKGIITVGQFFSLLIYSYFIFEPLQMLGTVMNSYRETEVSLKRYKEIIDKPIEPIPVDSKHVGHLENIKFQDVSFSYSDNVENAVDNISFDISKGETVAFVGPSGSGKTSVIKLIVGLYNPTKGEVSYNRVNSANINLNDLRSQIGFVTQDTQLFAGSIRENLLFVNPNATDEECLDVLHRSACDSLMSRAKEGLDTVIGEGGVKISGGEKQRLSIARALLRKPTLLVFDEATSSLDSITEEEITKTVRDVTSTKEHITVLVAHRLSTIMHADKIYVLEKGVVSESGTHDDLLSQKGLYYAMWRQQIGERV